MGFSRQEYWSGLPCISPGNIPNAGIQPASLTSPASAGRFFITSATWETHLHVCVCVCVCIKLSMICLLNIFLQFCLYSPIFLTERFTFPTKWSKSKLIIFFSFGRMLTEYKEYIYYLLPSSCSFVETIVTVIYINHIVYSCLWWLWQILVLSSFFYKRQWYLETPLS